MKRVANTIATLAYQAIFMEMHALPKLEAVIDEHFPDDPRSERPSLLELEKSAGLAIEFGHPLILDGLRPTSPNYIQVGMMDCRPGRPLPVNIEKFIAGSGDDGVVLVAFGSVLQASDMTEDMRLALVNVFRRLKQRVIWKWETEDMPDKPDNVMLSKWLPQPDILAHPKLKLFVTHGGQSSFQEALCHKKPMVTSVT